MMIQRGFGNDRRGFTLVELMVSAAISVVIMTILAYVFQKATDSMRQVRSQAEMADQLRAVGGVIQRDLGRDGGLAFAADENTAGISNYGVKLSDWPGMLTPSAGGYYIIVSPPSGVDPGTFDSNGFSSTTATNHSLQFTNVLPGLLEKDNYTAIVAGQTFTSPAAEIAYFLAPSALGLQTPSGTPLFDLHRRQWLVAKTQGDVGRLSQALTLGDPNVVNVISGASSGVVNTMQSVAGNLSPAGAIGNGDDILLSNVLSFEIKVNHSLANSFGAGNTDYPFDNLSVLTGSKFTSFGTPTPATPMTIRGLQIRIRVYDIKVQTARQMTIVQDL